MCVIIVKSKAAIMPTLNEMRNAMFTNPDGFSIAWSNNGKLEVFRTMSRKAMEDYYTKHFNEMKEKNFVFHARIATHGTRVLENCHGWKFNNDKRAFFHNGILSITNRDNMTDSETFLRDIYEPIFDAYGEEAATKAANAIIGGSKFAFIDELGNVRIFGQYTEIKGVYYSNLNHQRTYYKHTSYIDDIEREISTFNRPRKYAYYGK